jgi:YD repeat-containing protein
MVCCMCMQMGGIHPRLKRPVGRRLAHAIVQLVPGYKDIVEASKANCGSAKTGPTLAGCTLADETLQLHFNKSLLGSEALTIRPFDADMANWAWRYDSSRKRLNKTDSLGLMVCTASADAEASPGNSTTCQCSTWATLELAAGHSLLYCQHGPGWKPSVAMLKAGKHVKVQTNPFATQWTSLAVHQPPTPHQHDELSAREDVASVLVDLAPLGGRTPLAVRLAWPLFRTRVGTADDMCCVHSSQVRDQSDPRYPGPQGGTEVCVPGNCPIYSSVSELPANPFFAAIEGDKCKCQTPQVCDA